jgi:hypothetical protein
MYHSTPVLSLALYSHHGRVVKIPHKEDNNTTISNLYKKNSGINKHNGIGNQKKKTREDKIEIRTF